MNGLKQEPLGFFVSLALAVAPVLAAGMLGSLATLPAIPEWYVTIRKPWFTPPNWIFGPVWSVLYTIMAYTFFRLLRQPAPRGRGWVITAFMVQIAANAAWSVAFFGGRSPTLGMVVIVPLCLSVAWTLVLFWKRDKVAGGLMAPYLAWVLFAGALNFEIWRLNL